ncbi:MAG: metallophosphoesterase [Puniceicoccaceae bacterium]
MSRLLVIPDIHQDIAFLSRILDRENLDRYDQIILLGDYFDANVEVYASEAMTRLTAQFLLELVQAYPRKVRLCWGNHEIIYCRLREYVMREDPESVREQVGDSDLVETFQRPRPRRTATGRRAPLARLGKRVRR